MTWIPGLRRVFDPRPDRNAVGPSEIVVRITRDDVHPGDAAEPTAFSLPAGSDTPAILHRAADPRWLPTIADGRVAWMIAHRGIVLAVVEHDCGEGSVTSMPTAASKRPLRQAASGGETVRLHFHYRPECGARALFDGLRCAEPGT